jgi:poly(3-hydroxybutyrate) depolymerase
VDDIGFVKALIANLTATYCIDTGRNFAAGLSNGGGMTNVLACDPVTSLIFAAFAPVSGACYTSVTSTCNPYTVEPVNTIPQPICNPGRSNVPVIDFHGTGDGVISYLGGPRRGYCLPTVPHWTTEW